MEKIKDNRSILRAARKKQLVIYMGTSADFSEETLHATRECHNIFKVMRGKTLQTRIFYPARLSFKFEDDRKNFRDKKNKKEFSTTNCLYKIC